MLRGTYIRLLPWGYGYSKNKTLRHIRFGGLIPSFNGIVQFSFPIDISPQQFSGLNRFLLQVLHNLLAHSPSTSAVMSNLIFHISRYLLG